jgi:glutathione S-transferase
MAHLEVPQVTAWGEANRPRVLEVLQYLDEELGKRRYVAGPDYSVADITALVAIDFMKPARIQRPESLKNLARWHADVSERPSAKA